MRLPSKIDAKCGNTVLASNVCVSTKVEGYTVYYYDKATGKRVANTAKIPEKDLKNIALKKVGKNLSIAYKLNKGKLDNKTKKFTVGKGLSLTKIKPTRKGYKFKGWYKDGKFKKRIKSIPKTQTKKITLYAKWANKK